MAFKASKFGIASVRAENLKASKRAGLQRQKIPLPKRAYHARAMVKKHTHSVGEQGVEFPAFPRMALQ